MKTKLYLILMSLGLVLFLDACVNQEVAQVSPVKSVAVKVEPDVSNANKLILLTSQDMRSFQEKAPFKSSIFDVQEMNGKKNLKDSNYFIYHTILTVTYRPKTLYGNNYHTYTPYCPIFYDSHKKDYIEAYFNQMNALSAVNENEFAQYLSLTSFSSCASLNNAYQNKKKQLSENENIVLADKFAITIFLNEGKINVVNMIINHNDSLHQKVRTSEKPLKVFVEKMKKYQQTHKETQNLYQWWLLTNKVDQIKS
jgi:hypothetical protein